MNFFLQDEETKKFYNHGPYGNPFGGYTGMNSEAVSQTRDGHGSDGGGGNVLTNLYPIYYQRYSFVPKKSDCRVTPSGRYSPSIEASSLFLLTWE
jgi:hypothetical protein